MFLKVSVNGEPRVHGVPILRHISIHICSGFCAWCVHTRKYFKMLTKRLFGCVVVNPLVSQCNALKEMEELLTMGEKNVNDRSRNTSPSITFFCDLAFY